MDVEPISTDAAADVADAAPTTDAELTSEMGAVYDAHHSGQEAVPDTGFDNEPVSSESFADTEQPVETRQPSTGLEMPRSWAKDQAAVWNQLSPEAQAYVALREDQAHRKISELGHLAKDAGGDVHQVYEHYRSQGLVPVGNDGATELSVPEVIDQALAFDQALRQNPYEVIQALAQAHGVDLGGVQGQHVDLEQWQNAYGTVQQQLEQIKADYAQQQQREYDARVQWLGQELNSYVADKPHWGEIEDEVIAQVQALVSRSPGRTQDPMSLLREAEQRALKVTGLDPDAETKQAQKAAEQAQKAAEQKRKADEAKRLASLNAKSRSGHSPSETKDIWQTMADVYDRRNS